MKGAVHGHSDNQENFPYYGNQVNEGKHQKMHNLPITVIGKSHQKEFCQSGLIHFIQTVEEKEMRIHSYQRFKKIKIKKI